MATVPRSYIDGYADGLEDISREMKKALADALVGVDWHRPVAEVREELCTIMRTYCGASADLASNLASEFYSGLRLRMIGSAGTPLVTGGGYSDEAIDGAVRAVVQPLADGRDDAIDLVTNALLDRLGYEVKSAAGRTIFENGRRDTRKVRYARVPRGSKSYPNGCPFCQMLASRGFKYRSELTAGGLDPDHYHSDCQCMVVPGFGDNPKVEGYDPRDYDEGYKEWHDQDHSNHRQNIAERHRAKYSESGKRTVPSVSDSFLRRYEHAISKNGISLEDFKNSFNAELERVSTGMSPAKVAAGEHRTLGDIVMTSLINLKWRAEKAHHNLAELPRLDGGRLMSVARALTGTNPNYDPEVEAWSNNCVRCVATYFARRLGFTVRAAPYSGPTDPFMRDWTSPFRDRLPVALPAIPGGMSNRANVEAQMSLWGDGAMAVVSVQLRSNGGGHVFVAEQVGNDTMFVDPQTGEADVGGIFQDAAQWGVELLRLDTNALADAAIDCMD